MIRPTGVQPPYTNEELTGLVGAAAGMELVPRMTYLGALALGSGCGLIGKPALAIHADELVVRGDLVWVPCAWAAGGALPVIGRWARILEEVSTRIGTGAVTDIYSDAIEHDAGTVAFTACVGSAELAPRRKSGWGLCSAGARLVSSQSRNLCSVLCGAGEGNRTPVIRLEI